MDTYGGLFPTLDEAIASGLEDVLRASLAAPARPTHDTISKMRRSQGMGN